VQLGYARSSTTIPLEDVEFLATLAPRPFERTATGEEAVDQALQRPLGTPPLEDLARGARTAAILVSGKDRVTRADLFMPPLLRTLARAGISSADIRIVVATGTHVPYCEADLIRIAGGNLDPRIEVIGHDCMLSERLVSIGRSSFGSDISVFVPAYEADLRILTGRITHHYFAGFTAGRKAVLPGVCGFETIVRNHALVMSGNGARAVPRAVGNGKLDGNPVHLEMLEAARMFGPAFVLNTVLDARHGLGGVFAGELEQAHLAGCRLVDAHCRVDVDEPAPIVFASCGGEPYDISFMQALKTIFNCHEAVTDGGVLVVFAECPQGIRDGFLGWTGYATRADLAAAVRARYDLTGHNSYLLREVTDRIRVVLVSSCPRGDIERLRLVPAADVMEARRRALALIGMARPRAYAVPYGNTTVVERTH
jgi:nickel-dependent lactate racemase